MTLGSSKVFGSAWDHTQDMGEGQGLPLLLICFEYSFFFCCFSMGRNQYWAGRVYDMCVYYMTGTPEGSTESGFMEKPGIEPATPGLQGIALIHYTTGASHLEEYSK